MEGMNEDFLDVNLDVLHEILVRLTDENAEDLGKQLRKEMALT